MSFEAKTNNTPGGKAPQSAVIIHALMPRQTQKNLSNPRDIDDILEEAKGLALAINLDVLDVHVVKLSKVTPGSLFTKGIKEEIGQHIAELKPDIVIVNRELSPVQQRNLEKAWNAKVIDRTGLILEIFGARAQTKEGRIQVELAALDYQRSRLVRSWTHLERQRGGAGFMGGPGERQIELDRRMITQRMTKLKKELEHVKRTRDLGRKSRERVPFPIVALAGYTNAGKSTLFNQLTKANVFSEDLLFATLDPTMRKIKLPASGQDIIIADTVGFISDLPTSLVLSFRATLEQITYADIILHVMDVSREDHQAQRADVISILRDLDIDYENDPRVIEVYNKTDLLNEEEAQDLSRAAKFSSFKTCLVSAAQNKNLDQLLGLIHQNLSAATHPFSYLIPFEDGKALAWLHANGDVTKQESNESGKGTQIWVNLHDDTASKFEKLHGYMDRDREK